METYRGMKFRIYPDKKQQEMIDTIISNVNFVYNYYIRKQQDIFKESGKFLSLSQCIKELPKLKKEYPNLKKGESTSLQQALRHLDSAYSNFFDGRTQYPRFKSNHFDHSYTCTKNGCIPSNIRIEDEYLILPKLGKVKIKMHRPIPKEADITSATVQITPSGKYEVTLHIKTIVESINREVDEVIGLVYSPDYFFISSSGETGRIPEGYLKNETRIKLLKERIKRKKEGSANRIKENNRLRRAYRRREDIKRDYLHKWSRQLANRYSTIGILKEEGSTYKASQEGWNQFIQMLDYKLEEKGGHLIVIGHNELGEYSQDNRTNLATQVAKFIQT